MNYEDIDGKCCIKNCMNDVLAMGLCNKHWRRNKKYGSPVALLMPQASFKGKSPIDRFNLQMQKGAECWEWQSSKDKDGYGMFRGHTDDGVMYFRAHRFSIAYFKGSHPKAGQNVCHTCDNPSCVNPDHLFIGTVRENQHDKWKKGRGKVRRGEKSPHAKITEDIVREIRSSNDLQKNLAKKFGLTQTTISDIKRRRSWAHLK